MKLSSLSKTWSLAIKNNSALLVSNVMLSGLLTVSVCVNFSDHERIVLVPPHVDQKVEIAWNKASSEYLKSFGLYVATLIGNITPKNINLVADSVGVFLDPSIYPRARSQIIALAQDPVFQKANAINFFAPDQVVYEIDANKRQKVFVVGQLVTSSFETVAPGASRSDLKQVVYEMTMEMREGRPVITDFTSYPGHNPRTAKWLEGQQNTQKPVSKEGEE